MSRVLIFIFLLQVGCSASGHDRVAADWANKYAASSEQLLCAKAHGDNLFFVALNGDRVKTGYRVNVTSSTGAPLSYTIRWRFLNEHGRGIGAPDEPEVELQKYEQVSDSVFAIEVLYRRAYLDDARELSVSAALKVYEPSEQLTPKGGDLDLPDIFTCHVKLEPRFVQ